MSDILQEFLVQLGYRIDGASKRKFESAIIGTSVKLAALGAAAVAASASVTAAVAKISNELEQLYFVSQRTKASAANIQALGFAATQLGSSTAGAVGSLEALARFIRSSPGSTGLIESIGVQTRSANGELRDTAEIMGDLGRQFAKMPFYRAQAYANVFGIDEKTLLALIQDTGRFGSEYRAMLQAAGVDATKATAAAHGFMVQLRDLAAAGRVVSMKIGGDLAKALGPDIERLRLRFVANFDRIAAGVEGVLKLIVGLADVITTLGLRAFQIIGWLVDLWGSLGSSTQNVIKGILGIAAALWAISANPVIALATAILLLVDDYETWKEHGKSLIDWSAWKPAIDAAVLGIKDLIGWIKELVEWVDRAFNKLGAWAAKRASSNSFAKQGSPVNKALAALAYATGYDPRTGEKIPEQFLTGPAAGATGAGKRGFRNHNPGNIIGGAFARKMGAIGQDADGFAIFPDDSAGLRAMAANLNGYAARGIHSIRGAISRWAPPGKNDTASYIAAVSQGLGVSSDADVNLADPAFQARLMAQIVRHENGSNPYAAEQFSRASGAPVLHQTNQITVSGSRSPEEAGREVERGLDRTNQRLVRNLQASVR